MRLFVALFLLLQLASCIPTGGPVNSDNKRLASDSAPGQDDPSMKPRTDEIPATPAKKTLDKWSSSMTKSTNAYGGVYWSRFIDQSPGAKDTFFKKPLLGAGARYDRADLIQFLSKDFQWVLNQAETKKSDYWQYKFDGKWVAKGIMLSLTFMPDKGFGEGTIPGDDVNSKKSPVLAKVLSGRKHAEDQSYEEVEKAQPFPAGTTRYPQGTINVVFGYQPSDYELSKDKPEDGYVLKSTACPHVIDNCSTDRSNRSKTCTQVAAALYG
jgi:hypothetical protein